MVLLYQLVLFHLGGPTKYKIIFKNTFLVLTIFFFKHKINTTPEVQVGPSLQIYQEDPRKSKQKTSMAQTSKFYKEPTLKKQYVMFESLTTSEKLSYNFKDT